MKRISVLGLGYIGLPTAILAAQAGYEVCGYDIDQEKVKQINAGNPVIFEPEISDRLWKALQGGFFKAAHELQYADCFVIAVPTPFKEGNRADLTYVFQAAEAIAKRLMPGNLVILESTVPVGTTEQVAQCLAKNSDLILGKDFFVSHAPERVLPGRIFKELVENDRVVGGICQQACRLTQLFYSKFVKGFIHVTDDKSAEMIKLIENASRDVQIALANQVASMCKAANLDPYHVIELANKHPRVKLLTPTCGVGGHCIAVDPWFLIETFPAETQLLQVARAINDEKPLTILKQVLERCAELQRNNIARPKIFVMGLAFKPDVDDVRQSPALQIANALQTHPDALELKVYDHNVPLSVLQKYDFDIASDVWRGIAWADMVLVLVKHKEFSLMHQDVFCGKVVIDTCGLLYEMQSRQSRAILEGATRVDTPFWKTGVMKDLA
ncbi:nucleotide sugar dehydrogenase [Candidatus Dependentiae bacterium]|nr:nucleotide sugar dehydrogenase [Candidatus Dependentiae bacterium]